MTLNYITVGSGLGNNAAISAVGVTGRARFNNALDVCVSSTGTILVVSSLGPLTVLFSEYSTAGVLLNSRVVQTTWAYQRVAIVRKSTITYVGVLELVPTLPHM